MVKKTSWSSNYQNKTVNPVQDQKKTQPKATSSPICIDLDSASDKSSRSACSSKSGHTTRNSSKRKAEDEVHEAKKPKKAKKEVKKKKVLMIKENRIDLNQQNRKKKH